MSRFPFRFKRPWFYIVIHDVEGNDYLDGPYITEREAREKGFLKLKGVLFDIATYTTHDLSEANRRFKHERLEKTGDIRKAVRPVRHTASDGYIESQKSRQVRKIF